MKYNLICGDGLVELKKLESKTIDLILTDPPYNIADKSKLTKVGNKIVTNNEAWGNSFKDSWSSIDDYYDWLKPFCIEMLRVLKDDGSLLMFLDRKYTGYIVYRLETELGYQFKNKIYFHKKNPLPHIRKNNYRSSIEECVWLSTGIKNSKPNFYFGEQPEMTQVYNGSIGKKSTKHPTEKYSWMIEPLIKNHSKENDLILDPFAGSGSTLFYANKMNRNAIGFELNKDFYEIAKDRLNNLTK